MAQQGRLRKIMHTTELNYVLLQPILISMLSQAQTENRRARASPTDYQNPIS